MQVSVVVPTFKRPDLLARCLAALVEQSFDPTAYEIIVADDGSSDDTCHLVERLARATNGRPRLRYTPVCDTTGPAAARNAGWRAARGEIIAFTDDDCVPDPNWLQVGVDAFQPGISGVSGKVSVPLPACPTDYELNASHLENAEFVTASCFYRRCALEAVGGFDEHFQAAWREDCDLHFRLLETGHRLVTCAGAVVVHPVRVAPWGVSVGQQRKSMYSALLYKKHPTLYRKKIQTAPPWHYYRIVAALSACVAGLLAGRRSVAGASLLLWTVLTGRFCALRLRHTSKSPGHVAEMAITSAVIPPLSIFWRIRGAIRFRVLFF